MYRNLVLLQGRLGADAEFKSFDGSGHVANFRIATTKRFRDKAGAPQERTEWHPCSHWIGTESALNFFRDKLRKGALVDVEGELRHRQYEKNGETRYITEVSAERVQPLDLPAKKPAVDAAPTSPAEPEAPSQPDEVIW